MKHRRGLARATSVAAAMWMVAGCGPATPAEGPPAASGEPVATSAPSVTAAPETSAAPTAEPVATSAPAVAKPGVPIGDTSPPGTDPLSEAEKKELSAGACKKLSDAVAAKAKKDGGKKRPVDSVEEVLNNPPKLPGVDLPKCSALMRREMVSYLADLRESEAKLTLKRIAVGMLSALDKEPSEFCPGAGPVPATLDAMKAGAYQTSISDWSAPGWKCVRLDMSGAPQVWQYELKSDAKAKTFEAIARGFPVKGGPSTEIYIAGKVENGTIDMSMPILRRQP